MKAPAGTPRAAGKAVKNPRLTNPPPLFIIFSKAMTERDGDGGLQRAGGRWKPAAELPRVLWLPSRTFDNVGRPVSAALGRRG